MKVKPLTSATQLGIKRVDTANLGTKRKNICFSGTYRTDLDKMRSAQEAVTEKNTQNGETQVRVHLPRWNYGLDPIDVRSGIANRHYPVQHHGGDEGLGAEHYQERH